MRLAATAVVLASTLQLIAWTAVQAAPAAWTGTVLVAGTTLYHAAGGNPVGRLYSGTNDEDVVISTDPPRLAASLLESLVR